METQSRMTTRVCRLDREHDLHIAEQEVPAPGPGEVLVRIAAGGICGSDLHYFHHGGFGAVRVREPIILGHEASGRVERLGPGVESPKPGTLVAINPSHPCGHCRFCLLGQPQHCLDMHFLGSAMRLPHEQGAFRDLMVVKAEQLAPMGDLVSAGEAACTEPLSVCLHALRQAGELAGKRVLVSGSGPIGVLAVACAKLAGAREVIATDLEDKALSVAVAMGATGTINVGRDKDALTPYQRDKGHFDVAFECSGSSAGIAAAIATIAPRGVIVQVGLSGEATIPLSQLVGKEVQLRGSQRFHPEFTWAAELIASRRIDVRPMITATLPLEAAETAFNLAGDRARSCKVQLSFAAAVP